MCRVQPMTPTFHVGQRVRVRRRVTGMQYPYSGERGTIAEVTTRGGWGSTWYAVVVDVVREYHGQTLHWYAPEQLEAVT